MATKANRRTLAIGMISEGTLRNEDLIEAILGALEPLRLTKEERRLVREIREFDTLEEDAVVETLYDIASAHVPDYCRFGAHEGDGADIGVWVDWAHIEDDRTRVKADGSHSFLGEIASSRDNWNGERYALEANDHGNATLWRRTGKLDSDTPGRWVECWSVV